MNSFLWHLHNKNLTWGFIEETLSNLGIMCSKNKTKPKNKNKNKISDEEEAASFTNHPEIQGYNTLIQT